MRRAAKVVIAVGVVIGGCCGGFGVFNVTQKQFMCRSLQAEPRTNLSGLRRAEVAFREKHGHFTSDLIALDWRPDGSPLCIYGFAPKPGEPSTDTTDRGVKAAGSYSSEKMRFPRWPVEGNRAWTAADLPPSAAVSVDHFLAAAVCDAHGGDEFKDVWSIDESGELRNVEDDCTWTRFHPYGPG